MIDSKIIVSLPQPQLVNPSILKTIKAVALPTDGDSLVIQQMSKNNVTWSNLT